MEENMNRENALEILNMNEETFTFGNLKRQWKKMIFENHPDRGGNEEKFKLISLAYGYLQEEIRKELYLQNQMDEFLTDIMACIMEDDLTSW